MMASIHKTVKREKGRWTAFCECSIAWNMGRGRPTPIGWLIFSFSIVWIDSICDMEIFYKYIWSICSMVCACVLHLWNLNSVLVCNMRLWTCAYEYLYGWFFIFTRFIFYKKYYYLINFRLWSAEKVTLMFQDL